MPRVFYRVVYHDPPTREDFLSDEERGVEPATPDEDLSGMTVWSKIGDARSLAKWQVRSHKEPHAYVAAVTVEDGAPFRLTHSPDAVDPPRSNHWTLEGDPDALAEIASVVERYPE